MIRRNPLAVVFYILAAFCLAAGFSTAYRGTQTDHSPRWSVAGVLLTTAGMLWWLGFPLLAILSFLSIAPAFRRPRELVVREKTPSRLWTQVAPILLAAALGLAAPVLLDADIETGALPPPVEGASAAVGGSGLAYAFLQRGLLMTVAAITLLLVVWHARALTRAAQHRNAEGEGT